MDKLFFSISELCIEDKPIPLDVADKLLEHHIWPMNPVRKALGSPVRASMKAGFRSVAYEISKGRTGTSQHCFVGDCKGAVDWTTDGDITKLLALIFSHTDYTRICYYPNNKFIHCDYKFPEQGRQYFEASSPTSAWVLKTKLSKR